MTLDEAIKHAEEVAKTNTCKECAEEHRQLAEWLKDYKRLLEQEPKANALDKIRDKIMQLDYDIETVDYDYNDMSCTEEVHMICREEVLRIIGKYKAESEGRTI